MAIVKNKEKQLTASQREIVAERDEVTKKLEEISKLVDGITFENLGEKEQVLIVRQHAIMHNLVGVLNARIAIFE
jgi:hypothetical protein